MGIDVFESAYTSFPSNDTDEHILCKAVPGSTIYDDPRYTGCDTYIHSTVSWNCAETYHSNNSLEVAKTFTVMPRCCADLANVSVKHLLAKSRWEKRGETWGAC